MSCLPGVWTEGTASACLRVALKSATSSPNSDPTFTVLPVTSQNKLGQSYRFVLLPSPAPEVSISPRCIALRSAHKYGLSSLPVSIASALSLWTPGSPLLCNFRISSLPECRLCRPAASHPSSGSQCPARFKRTLSLKIYLKWGGDEPSTQLFSLCPYTRDP